MKISFNNISLNPYLAINKTNKNSANRATYPNLAPLQADTVSFSGRAKLSRSDMRFAPPENICKQVCENAEPARYFLEKVFDKYLSQYTVRNIEDSPQKKPIQSCKTRTKSSSSIREKVVSKFSRIAKNESEDFSTRLTDLLSKHFPYNPGVTRETVLEDISTLIDYNYSDSIKLPPYANVPLYFDDIIAGLQLTNRFDFNSVSFEKRAQIFEGIKRTLSDGYDDSHHIESRYFDPTKVKGVKHYANDIVGGRIIMRESGSEYTGVVLDALKQAVENGEIVINSIENNVPDPKRLPQGKTVDDYAYATNKQLKTLANAAGAKLTENKSKSGYLAVHLNISFPSDLLKKYNGVFDGFDGEIQIIGQDVLDLKEVEDMCYKLKDNKNIVDDDYRPFKQYFLKYYNQSPEVQKAFDDYTYALYLSQRALPPQTSRTNRFPSIADLGFEGKVPEELDFNTLKSIKKSCDLAHEETIRAQESALSESKNKRIEFQAEKRHCDIDSLKKLIHFSYS